MKRLIDEALLRWKTRENRKPLIIRGARQVGKTYSVEQFGRQHFESFLKIDFELERSIHKAFAGDLSAQNLLLQFEAAYGQRIIPGKTLLFFDEIQEGPRALMALRYFYEQMPALHVIAAGSLLEFTFDEISFPVGRVQFQWLRPLGFREFLWAMDMEPLAESLPSLSQETPLSEVIHDKFLQQLSTYFIVGGMPEAVFSFVRTSSLAEVKLVHQSLYRAYVQDFVKYRKRVDVDLLDHVFQQLPAKTGSRIKYTGLYPEKRVEKIKESVNHLEHALLFQKVRSSTAQGIPLGASASDKVFKTIFVDIGLMQHICGIPPTSVLGQTSLLDVYRGALAEQFVGQELLLYGGSENDKLYYWNRMKKSSSAEVDFLIAREGEIYPVEVKSGRAGRLKSMKIFLDEHPHCPWGMVLNTGNIHRENEGKLRFMPIYTLLRFG
ncbi:MAG: ATP-binding protein [bacterium]